MSEYLRAAITAIDEENEDAILEYYSMYAQEKYGDNIEGKLNIAWVKFALVSGSLQTMRAEMMKELGKNESVPIVIITPPQSPNGNSNYRQSPIHSVHSVHPIQVQSMQRPRSRSPHRSATA